LRTRQRCEKFRTDVLLLDETMMTYMWMRDVQGPKMEPWGIVFPNHYHAPPSYSHVPDTYSMEQFLAANAKNFKKHPLFKAGAWLGDVAGLADGGVPNWHLVPVGLVAKVMRKGKDMSSDDFLKWYNKKLFPAEPDYYRFDDAAWEWLMRRIVLEWRAKVAFRFSNIAVEKAQASGDISWLKNATADLEDILRLEMLPEGDKDKSYILADLYNAIGMLTVHMQVCVCVCVCVCVLVCVCVCVCMCVCVCVCACVCVCVCLCVCVCVYVCVGVCVCVCVHVCVCVCVCVPCDRLCMRAAASRLCMKRSLVWIRGVKIGSGYY